MSYFTTLMRQTGITPGSAAPRAAGRSKPESHAIEITQTRVVGTAATPESPPETIPTPGVAIATPGPAPAAPARREPPLVQASDPSPHQLDALPSDRADGIVVVKPEEPPSRPPGDAPARPPRPPSEPPPPAAPRRPPTLGEVRAWVAKPPLGPQREGAEGPGGRPSAVGIGTTASPPMSRSAEASIASRPPESHTIEIGTIQISFEEPAAAPTPRTAVRRREAPAAAGRASRHYVR